MVNNQQIARLQPWETAKEAYRLAWEHRVEYVKISWCWLGLAAPVLLLYTWLEWPVLSSICDVGKRRTELEIHGTRTFLLSALLELLVLGFGVSIAVAWHRLILRKERISGVVYLRLDGVVWSYFSLALFLFFLQQGPNLIDSALQDRLGIWAVIASGLLIVFLSVAAAIFTVRVWVLLPAKALGETEITIAEAWRRTRGNFWRLFWGQVCCSVIGIPLYFVLRAGCGLGFTGPLCYALGIWLGMMFCAPVLLSFLSLSYRHFFEDVEANRLAVGNAG
jgi:hypothetical protein